MTSHTGLQSRGRRRCFPWKASSGKTHLFSDLHRLHGDGVADCVVRRHHLGGDRRERISQLHEGVPERGARRHLLEHALATSTEHPGLLLALERLPAPPASVRRDAGLARVRDPAGIRRRARLCWAADEQEREKEEGDEAGHGLRRLVWRRRLEEGTVSTFERN